MKKPQFITKNFLIITALFITTILVSNIASTKLFEVFGLTIDGGTILFPLAYILGDIITEVYGFKAAKKVIFMGFFMSILMSATLFLVQILPPADGWTGQAAYEQILGLLPRVIAGSLVAYILGELINSYILARLKVMTSGRYLWIRTIGSTLVAALVDTAVFSVIAFYGIIPLDVLISLILTVYVVKVAIEIGITPITYMVVNRLKKQDGIDTYDRDMTIKTVLEP